MTILLSPIKVRTAKKLFSGEDEARDLKTLYYLLNHVYGLL